MIAAAASGSAQAGPESLPSVASGHRPGPDILYAPRARAPQLENRGPWRAAPILVSGAAAYRDGEYLYQDHIFDDHGAAGVNDPNDPLKQPAFAFSPKTGTLTYPTDRVFAGNAADLVELRIKPLANATALRVTLNSLRDPARTGIVVAIGGSATPRVWPHGAGVRSPAQLFLTIDGLRARLTNALTGTAVSPSPTVAVDVARRQYDVRIPDAAFDPGTRTVRFAAGAGLWDPAAGRFLTPGPTATATTPGGIAPSAAALFNVAFRFGEGVPEIDNPPVGNTVAEGGAGVQIDGRWWRERAQAEALRTGDVSPFFADVDFAKLAARRRDDSRIPKTGHFNRIHVTHFPNGQGFDPSGECLVSEGPSLAGLPSDAPPCAGRFRGELQPYAVYVPRKPRPRAGYGLTFALHGLSANHNEFLGSRHAEQLGERAGGSIVAGPLGRGPDNFWRDFGEAEVFEIWADLARVYRLDPSYLAVSGYSMGGQGSFRLGSRWPDLFARIAPIVGPAVGIEEIIPSLRNTPVMAWYATPDELVNPALQLQGRQAMIDAGLNFEQWTFPGGHITLGNNDYYQPQADFLGNARVNRNPPHLTFVVDADQDSPGVRAVANHASWLSDIRLRPGVRRGRVDASSLAFGVGKEPVLPLRTETGTMEGGAQGPKPYTREIQGRGRAPAIRRQNRVVIDASGIASLTIDARRARIGCDAAIEVRGSDRPRVTLAGCGRGASGSARRCVPGRGRFRARGFSRLRIGATRKRILRWSVKPRKRSRNRLRYCAAGRRGTVTATFRRGRLRLVTSTVRTHRAGRLRPGVRASKARRRVRVGRRLYRAGPRSRVVFATGRAGRVRYVGVASRSLLVRKRALARAMRGV